MFSCCLSVWCPSACPWHLGFFLISWKRKSSDGYLSIPADTLISIRFTYLRKSKWSGQVRVIALCKISSAGLGLEASDWWSGDQGFDPHWVGNILLWSTTKGFSMLSLTGTQTTCHINHQWNARPSQSPLIWLRRLSRRWRQAKHQAHQA